MKKTIIVTFCFIATFLLVACNNTARKQETINMDNDTGMDNEKMYEEHGTRKISVQRENGFPIIFELNNGKAATELYNQLPIAIEIGDFSNNEKIFYPPKKLNISDTPLAEPVIGTLAYYAPWGDVVMFYDKFNANSSLYEIGHVVSGGELIKELSGKVKIDKL